MNLNYNGNLYPAYPYMQNPLPNQNSNKIIQASSSATPSMDQNEQPYQIDQNWSDQYPGNVFNQGSSNCKLAALTFDDAPDALFGPLLLDVLLSYNVKATFFCLGTCVQKNPDLVDRMVKEEHIVANHSYDHADLTTLTPDQIREEVSKAEAEIQNITGLRTAIFRPPYGVLNNESIQVVLSMGYKIVLWNVDSLDWTGIPGPSVAAQVVPKTVPGSIILMHNACDGAVQAGTGTTQSLGYIIEILRAEGYNFVTIPALLNIPAYQYQQPSANPNR